MQMLSLGAEKKHRPSRAQCLPDGIMLLPVAISGDTGTSRFHDSSWTRLVRRPTSSYQERSVAEKVQL
jgi:hypothetical protein